MSRSNWRFFGCFVLVYSAFALPWAFPQAAFSQEAAAEVKTSRQVIEGEEFRQQSSEAKMRWYRARMHVQQAEMQEQQAQMQEQVAKFHEEKEKFARALQEAHRELEQSRRGSMPPLEKTETRVFHLQHINGNRLRKTLERILGPQLIRLSADASPQILVVRAGEKSLSTVESLIAEMDKPEVVSKSKYHSELPRSLIVRIFWLSDDEISRNSQPAEEYLPDPVILALQRVGIETPYIVLQSNTSVALDENDEASFEVHDLSAIVFQDRMLFTASGQVRTAGGDQLRLRMEASVKLQDGDGSHVSGSMIAPLEHFVVLGTANYASPRPDKLPGDGTLSSSRFAFVVQTIESQSFAPEE